MAREKRERSSTGYAHLITRGNNKQILFEEDDNYRFYLSRLGKYAREQEITSQRGLTPLTQGEMKMSIFTGCGTALITPFKHGEIDWPALDNLVESQIEAGINALFCETSPIPCKAAMAALGMCEDELRLPLVPMQQRNRPRLCQAMKDLGMKVKFPGF